jgi:hypothetical protein
MKTRNLIRLIALLLVITGLSFTGCKKDKTDNSTVDPTSMQQLANDEAAEQNASDEAMNDVDIFLAGNGLKSTDVLPCHATIDSTRTVGDTITIYITYNGLNCSGTRYRTGHVEIKKLVGIPWSQAGATIIVRHINFTIRKVASNKTITLNGTKTHQNESGGVIWNLGNGTVTSVIHKTWGFETVTFSDNTTRTWNIARRKTFTGTAPDAIVLTNDGFGVAEQYSNLVVWGTNRQGENFFTQIIQPVVMRQKCDWDPCAGIKVHQIPSDSKSATITFGFNSNNQPISGDECPTKYKLDWQKNNHSGTVYLLLP